ncbi:ABC transporter ATP-binding protein [Flavicella marina]|uniref:ABC transporter ATP-binding protein n=1 Tax=Flavicella marina TaxID=1475951 RepID=UPI0012658B74|nr:ATP-binding cassette domain-containing protein [Flavicella marina]
MLKIDQVSKHYGEYTALDAVSLEVPKGSVFGLLGPNGAGKTSLIRILNQIILPDEGTVYLDGEQLQPKHISQIGYLPEERGLYKSMKVGEQALYLARLKGMTKKEATTQLKYWFEKFEISDWWHKKIQELSKGMAQKVQFIVTVLHKPKLLIFDEPFSGFDPVNAELIAKEILLLKDEGATIIFSTHRMESVEKMCDHIALIHQSKKILDGKISEIQKQYKTNIFDVGVVTNDESKLTTELKEVFEVKPSKLYSFHDAVKFQVKTSDKNTSEKLLQLLQKHGEVIHFSEQIPTMNSIFMQAVSNKTSLK